MCTDSEAAVKACAEAEMKRRTMLHSSCMMHSSGLPLRARNVSTRLPLRFQLLSRKVLSSMSLFC